MQSEKLNKGNAGDLTQRPQADRPGGRKLPKRQTAADGRKSGFGNRRPGTHPGGQAGNGILAAAKKAGDGELARQGRARRPWRATAFACSRRRSTRVPQARLKVATRREPVETGATDSPFFVCPSPRRGV